MDNIKNIEKTERYQERIKELFKETVSNELYDMWTDTFDIQVIDENHILIAYYGTESIKKFKNNLQTKKKNVPLQSQFERSSIETQRNGHGLIR